MNAERLRWLGTKCSRLFRRGKAEAALNAEMQFHFDQLVAEFQADGLSAEEARLAAQREFGTTEVYREEIRDTWRPPELADLWRSLRLAAWSLMRTPGFALLAIVTLALGVGANTAMFTALSTVMLKPLPYPDSAQLDRIYRTTPQTAEGGVSPADFFDLQREVGLYGAVAAYAPADVSISEPGRPAEIAPAVRISSSFFSTLGVPPQLGRDFQPGEDRRGNDRVVVINHRVWQNRFGGRADIIGHVIRIDGVPHEIVGVLPVTFNDWRFLGWADVFRPLGLDQQRIAARNAPFLQLIGRRSGPVSRAAGEGFFARFGARLAFDFPAANSGSTWRMVPLSDTFPGKNAPGLFAMLVGLAVSVLLVACSNLANLFMARTMGRAREFAVRSALGASRLQVLRPLIAESLLLALAGGVCALFVARWAGDWMSVQSTAENGEQVVFAVDWRVLCWALAVSLFTAFAFGLAPALFVTRLDVNATLKSGARGITGDRWHRRFRDALIIGQFALALVLLAGAALFIRGLDDLNHRGAGWDIDHLVTGNLLLPAAAYADADQITRFHRLAIERLEALSGVASASVSYRMPFFNWYNSAQYVVEGYHPPEPGHEPTAFVNGVSPHYFETVGTRLLAGRTFSERDSTTSPRVFVINQAMARGLFGDKDPIGRRLAQAGGESPQWGEIVGVVSDVESVLPQSALAPFQLYQPMAQAPHAQVDIAVRTAGVAPSTVLEDIRGVMAKIDPDLPVRQLQPAGATIVRANTGLSVVRDMLAGFAVLGLSLASLGVYGVTARTMAQRRGEFAIRLAMGASMRDLNRIVLTSGVKLASIGSALGLLGAFGVARLLAAGLPGMRVSGFPVLLGATLPLIAVALIASYLPARKAARISPMDVLRLE